MFRRLLRTDGDISGLVLRVTLGVVMFPHGAQKVLGWFGGYGLSGTMGFFTDKLGIPAVFAVLAIAAEFLGALGLTVGLLTRVAAFGIACVMVVATLMLHLQHCIRRLLTKQPVTHDIAGMVVDDPHQVHTVHALELEGKDVDLPHRIGNLSLEASLLGWPTFRNRRGIPQSRLVHHPSDRFRAYCQSLFSAKFVPDAPHPCLRVLPAARLEAAFKLGADLPGAGG
jgi:uncharacterized membrane protein YphA (DoxX/SURF4 family)